MDTVTVIGNFLLPRTGISPARVGEFASKDYVEAGLIDSLGIIELIAHVEEMYGIQFTAEQMADPRFRTMHGLAELIDEAGRV